MFDFSIVTSWVHELLTSFMPLGLAIFIECVIVGLCMLLMYDVIAILMIFMERKVCAAFQCRLGPCAWAVGYAAGHLRRIQDAHQGDHHHPPLGQVPLQPRTVHRHPRLGAGVRLPACQQGSGDAGLQRGRLLHDGRLVDRCRRHPAGGWSTTTSIRSSAPCEAVRR